MKEQKIGSIISIFFTKLTPFFILLHLALGINVANAQFANPNPKLGQINKERSLLMAPEVFQMKKITAKTLNLPKNTIALTFDDGPSSRTADLMKVLIAYNIPATFFMVSASAGNYVSSQRFFSYNQNMKNALAISNTEKGRQLFIVANHSKDHKNFNAIAPNEWVDELIFNHIYVVAPNNKAPIQDPNAYYFFRAPYGNFTPAMANFFNTNTYPQVQAAVAKYVGPIYWDIGGFYDTDPRHGDFYSNPKKNYIGDWTCWTKEWSSVVKAAGQNPLQVCRNGYYQEIIRSINNPRNTNGVIVLAHDSHLQSVEMMIGSSYVDGQGVLHEDQNSLLAKLMSYETAFNNDPSNKGNIMRFTSLDEDVLKVIELRNNVSPVAIYKNKLIKKPSKSK